MYRAGEFELARELFAAAASRAKAAVAARSMYNRGTTSYAQALEGMKSAGDPASPEAAQSGADAQKAAIEQLERSLRELKDAVRADPKNADARANAELAYRVLKELKKQQEQQKQDQQQQQQQDDQQKQDQQQQQQNDQQKQDQQQQQQSDQQKQDQQQQQQSDQQKQDQQQQQNEPKPSEAKEDKQPMTKQEVERLLQRIRDKERARVMEKLVKERARTKPAPKDW
jgi:Ca-activated chloride channel family protein